MDWRDKLSGLKNDLPAGKEIKLEPIEAKKNSRQENPVRIELDKRKGKPATLITEFLLSDGDLKDLARKLKIKCGVGGSSRDGEILIQGDFRPKIAELLVGMGYKVKRINFK